MSKSKARLKRRWFLVTKEVVMMLLALLCLAGLALEHLEHLNEQQLYQLEVFEIIVGVIFLVEFGFEWYFFKNRLTYWRHHWYFLLSAVPLPTQTFEILRSIRLLRLVRLFKIFAHLRYEENTWLFEKKRY